MQVQHVRRHHVPRDGADAQARGGRLLCQAHPAHLAQELRAGVRRGIRDDKVSGELLRRPGAGSACEQYSDLLRASPCTASHTAAVQVRFLARGFTISGDHTGQTSTGVRWPFGPVCLITPFNFPLEIPVLQLMGALYMGNKPLLHVDHRVSIVVEQFLRLLIDCGMPATDVDMLHGPGSTMGHILEKASPRSTLFTGA